MPITSPLLLNPIRQQEFGQKNGARKLDWIRSTLMGDEPVFSTLATCSQIAHAKSEIRNAQFEKAPKLLKIQLLAPNRNPNFTSTKNIYAQFGRSSSSIEVSICQEEGYRLAICSRLRCHLKRGSAEINRHRLLLNVYSVGKKLTLPLALPLAFPLYRAN